MGTEQTGQHGVLAHAAAWRAMTGDWVSAGRSVPRGLRLAGLRGARLLELGEPASRRRRFAALTCVALLCLLWERAPGRLASASQRFVWASYGLLGGVLRQSVAPLKRARASALHNS